MAHCRRIFLGWLALSVLAGCLSKDSSRPIGGACRGDGDCSTGLLCDYGRCRQVCFSDRQCPGATVCVPSDDNPEANVCTLPDEGQGQACPAGLEVDDGGDCRRHCEPNTPGADVVCGNNQTCTAQGWCRFIESLDGGVPDGHDASRDGGVPDGHDGSQDSGATVADAAGCAPGFGDCDGDAATGCECPRLFWTDKGDPGRIQSALANGTDLVTLVSDASYANPYGIAVDADGGKVYWADYGPSVSLTTTDGTIRRCDLDGGNVELVLDGLLNPNGLALDLVNDWLYWTEYETGEVYRARTNGTESERIWYDPSLSPLGIAVDPSRGRVYWTEDTTRGAGSIFAADSDGSNPEQIVTGLLGPEFLALDAVEGRLYWTDTRNETVERANVDGTGSEILAAAMVAPSGIALDVEQGLVYWLDYGSDTLYRARMDGSDQVVIIDEVLLPGALGDPRGLALP